MRSPLRLLLGSVLVSEGSAAGAPEAEGTSLLLLFLFPANKAAAAMGGLGGKEAATAAGTTRATTGNGLTDSLLEAGKGVTTAGAASFLVDLRVMPPLPPLPAVVVASEAVVLVSRNCNIRNMAAQHPKITLTRRVFRIMFLARH